MTMKSNRRVLVCEFHEETNTFNPVVMTLDGFKVVRYAEAQEAYDLCKELPCAFHGMMDAIEQNGGEVVPAV